MRSLVRTGLARRVVLRGLGEVALPEPTVRTVATLLVSGRGALELEPSHLSVFWETLADWFPPDVYRALHRHFFPPRRRRWFRRPKFVPPDRDALTLFVADVLRVCMEGAPLDLADRDAGRDPEAPDAAPSLSDQLDRLLDLDLTRRLAVYGCRCGTDPDTVFESVPWTRFLLFSRALDSAYAYCQYDSVAIDATMRADPDEPKNALAQRDLLVRIGLSEQVASRKEMSPAEWEAFDRRQWSTFMAQAGGPPVPDP